MRRTGWRAHRFAQIFTRFAQAKTRSALSVLAQIEAVCQEFAPSVGNPGEVGLGLQIARSCSIGLGTVHEYLQRGEAAGVTWPLDEDWDEGRLEAALFGGPPRKPSA
jgi:hypothetical protein